MFLSKKTKHTHKYTVINFTRLESLLFINLLQKLLYSNPTCFCTLRCLLALKLFYAYVISTDYTSMSVKASSSVAGICPAFNPNSCIPESSSTIYLMNLIPICCQIQSGASKCLPTASVVVVT